MKKSNKIAIIIAIVPIFMFVLAFASVPLYNMFCKITGYGGTPKIAEGQSSAKIIDREFKVSFNTDVSQTLGWEFYPKQKEVTVKGGESKLIYFVAKNVSNKASTGMATFNVTPEKAGQFFTKVQCFCFQEQLLKPGEEIEMPVQFYIDPKIDEQENLKDIKEVTLSYTFFNIEDAN